MEIKITKKEIQEVLETYVKTKYKDEEFSFHHWEDYSEPSGIIFDNSSNEKCGETTKVNTDELWVVFYCSTELEVFGNEEDAKIYFENVKKEFPALDWRIETLSDYGFATYKMAKYHYLEK